MESLAIVSRYKVTKKYKTNGNWLDCRLHEHNLKLIISGSLIVTIIVVAPFISQVALSSLSFTELYWNVGAPMPMPRSEIAGALLNDKIYIIGGFDNGSGK